MTIVQSSFSSKCNHFIVNYMLERALKRALYLQMDEGIRLDRTTARRLCFAWLVSNRHNSLLKENNHNGQQLFRRQINPVSACSSVTGQGPRWQRWQKSKVTQGTGEEMKDNSPVDGKGCRIPTQNPPLCHCAGGTGIISCIVVTNDIMLQIKLWLVSSRGSGEDS